MDRILKRLASPAMVVACTALVVALGGVSYAAGVLPANSVGAKQLKRHAVTSQKLSPAVRDALKGRPDNARTAGAAAAGDRRATSSLYANVRGTALVSGNATAVQNPAAGEYVVSFARDVSSCAAVASPGITAVGGVRLDAVGAVTVGDDALPTNQLRVEFHARDASGVLQATDTDFHLIVTC